MSDAELDLAAADREINILESENARLRDELERFVNLIEALPGREAFDRVMGAAEQYRRVREGENGE